MKYFSILIITLIYFQCHSQEISLDAFSLISSQLDFLEDMCYNRTKNFTTFEKLRETIEECQMAFLNGTSLSLSFNDLTTADPKEFYKFYSSQCNDKNAIQLRNKCNVNAKTILSECLNGTEIQAFNKIEDIANRLYDVVCNIDKEKMNHFFSKQGQECLVDNVISIGFCFLQVIPEDVREKQEMLFKLIDGKECKVIEDIESCVIPGIDNCDEKTVSQIFRLLFNFFRNELSCDGDEKLKQEIVGDVNGSSKAEISIVLLTIVAQSLAAKLNFIKNFMNI